MADESREAVVAKAVRYLLDTYSPSGTRVGWLMIATIFIEAWDLYSISFVLIFIGQVFHPSPLIFFPIKMSRSRIRNWEHFLRIYENTRSAGGQRCSAGWPVSRKVPSSPLLVSTSRCCS